MKKTSPLFILFSLSLFLAVTESFADDVGNGDPAVTITTSHEFSVIKEIFGEELPKDPLEIKCFSFDFKKSCSFNAVSPGSLSTNLNGNLGHISQISVPHAQNAEQFEVINELVNRAITAAGKNPIQDVPDVTLENCSQTKQTCEIQVSDSGRGVQQFNIH